MGITKNTKHHRETSETSKVLRNHLLSDDIYFRIRRSTAVNTYQIQIKHSSSNTDPLEQLLKSVQMIRIGYTEFGRQVAITIVNLLVFAVETVVGIFIQAPN